MWSYSLEASENKIPPRLDDLLRCTPVHVDEPIDQTRVTLCTPSSSAYLPPTREPPTPRGTTQDGVRSSSKLCSGSGNREQHNKKLRGVRLRVQPGEPERGRDLHRDFQPPGQEKKRRKPLYKRIDDFQGRNYFEEARHHRDGTSWP